MIYKGYGVQLRADFGYLEAYHWRNDPQVFKWCRQFTDISMNDHSEWYESLKGNTKIKMFGIYPCVPSNEELRCVGVCGLTSIDHVNQKAEFSLYIGPSQQKKGYGRRALATLITHGFDDFNLNRIWGETYEGNPAFQIFDRLGFKKEGRLRQTYFREGQFIDSIIVGLLREEWCKLRHGFKVGEQL